MGRNLSPVLRRELANLDKDPDSRRSAMKALKSYVKDLDSKAIPLFLAQVSETKETGSLSGEFTISLYEVLARVHGVNIVPQIDSIMATIIKTLASSAGSFPLQQACSKVVPSIARYGIDPTTPDDKKRHVIHSLCKPLSDSLIGSQESLTSGAALCLKALVESDNWRFASDDIVNTVCQNVAVALGKKSTQSNSHMTLVTALAKHNPLIAEAYARLFIQSGLHILSAGVEECNSQKRLSAIQMINFLMKCLDYRSIFSELDLIIEELEKFQNDQMAYVSGAAFEALQTAKKLAQAKGLNRSKSPGSVTGSNFSRSDRRGKLLSASCWSPGSMSPESQTLDSFAEYDSWVGSPILTPQTSPSAVYDRRSVNRKLWKPENGGVDVSLKDGLFSKLSGGSPINGALPNHNGFQELDDHAADSSDFAGFFQRSSASRQFRTATPSPQRTRSYLNVEDISIFTTPRKLIHSLQDPQDLDSDLSEKLSRRFTSPCSSKFECSPITSKFNQNGIHHDAGYESVKVNHQHSNPESEQFQDSTESVSSTDNDPVNNDPQVSPNVILQRTCDTQRFANVKSSHKTCRMILGYALVVLALLTALIWIDNQNESCGLVPT